MNVTGLENNYYLINNPIYLDVTDISPEARYVTISINDNDLRFYTGPTRQISVDLRDVIKGMFPEPKHPDPFEDGGMIPRNILSATVNISEEAGDNVIFTDKKFIRGGRRTQHANIHIEEGDLLKVTDKMPAWKGFPFMKYRLTPQGIQGVGSATFSEVDVQRVLGRNPIYVRFLNSLGGYSFWLFENYFEQVTAESKEVITRREGDFHLGSSTSTQITVEGRVRKPYYDLMRSLIKSPEVYIFSNENWTLCSVASNSIELNNYEEVQRVSISFDVRFSEKTSIKW